MQSLWVGPRLSTLERLCIASHLHHGHKFRLYTYGDEHGNLQVEGIPAGTTLLNANEILPRESIFQYEDYPTYAGFADFFRWKLLSEQGGWWVDMDTVCLKPFDFPSEYVFSSGTLWKDGKNEGRYRPNNAAVKAPANSAAMRQCWSYCKEMDSATLKWGFAGPGLLVEVVYPQGLQRYIQPPDVFCPVKGDEWGSVLDPGVSFNFPDETVAVHFWNELWRRNGRDKDAQYPPDCLYEILKRRYL